ARLYFDELLKGVLPMSQWWHDYAQKPDKKPIHFGAAATRNRLVSALKALDESEAARRGMTQPRETKKSWVPKTELLWLVRRSGVMLAASAAPDSDSLRERQEQF